MMQRMRRHSLFAAVALAAAVAAAGCGASRAYGKGQSLEKAGDWDTAVSHYRRAVQESPDRPEYKIQLERAMQNAADSAALETDDGETVGTAAVSWMHQDRVLVVQLNQAPVGVRYRCRVEMTEGNKMVLSSWQASSAKGGTWVMPAPQGDLSGVELVTNSGQVWSSAWLP